MVLMGATLDPHAAYLILRGMKTYHLRRRQQVQNALALAEWLEAQPEVEYVLYPGLKSHPQYPYFQERYEDSGSMIFFRLKNKEFPLDLMVDKGECFKLAASLGSTESLITPALYFFGGDLTPVERDRLGLDASAVRLSIGIEALIDLKSDLRQLLDRVGAYSPE
jgi:cystathionine beta-lyase/cystathionine gamma-synthase